jgi:hypothetical protein
MTIETYANILDDITTLERKGVLSAKMAAELAAEAQHVMVPYELELKLLKEHSIVNKLIILAKSFRLGYFRGTMLRIPRLLPLSAYRLLYIFRKHLHSLKSISRNC